MFKVGKYIACWKRPYYLNSICGCVTDAKEIDENRVSYTIKTSNGGTAEIIYTGKNIVEDYVSYSCSLNVVARDYIESVERAKKFLKEFLGDSLNEAGEIAENCEQRKDPFKIGEEVIVYPWDAMHHLVEKYEVGEIANVLTLSSSDSMYEEYSSENNLKRPCDKYKYIVRINDGRESRFTGIDFTYNREFIGTREEFVTIIVKMTNTLIEEIKKIVALRKKLYDQVKNTGLNNQEHAKMTFEIEIPELITSGKRITKK